MVFYETDNHPRAVQLASMDCGCRGAGRCGSSRGAYIPEPALGALVAEDVSRTGGALGDPIMLVWSANAAPAGF